MKREDKIIFFAFICLFLFFAVTFLFSLCFSQGLDVNILNFFRQNLTSFLFKSFKLISNIFDPLKIAAFSLVLSLVLFLKKKKEDSLFLLSASLLGLFFGFVFKEIIQRQRPENFLETGFGFPSGHAVMAIVFFCCLIYLSRKYFKEKEKMFITFFSILLIVIILLGRLYLGVHWFSDVLGGIFLGGFVFLFNLYFFEKMK